MNARHNAIKPDGTSLKGRYRYCDARHTMLLNSFLNCIKTIFKPSSDCQTAKRPRILCVDDNDFVRDGICSFLSINGLESESAKSGYDALHLLTFRPESIDFLVTDHRMPDMNGLELVRNARATAFSGKILIYSTMLHAEELAAYQELAVDAILLKNGNPVQLLTVIKELQQMYYD